MTNIISSDLFRVRRGAAVRNTLIGIAGLILIVGITFTAMSNEGVQRRLSTQISAAQMEEFTQDMQDLDEYIPTDGMEFAWDMISEYILPLFFLPVIIAVFGADFSARTYRNTLSYQTNRTQVYLSKLITSIVVCGALAAALFLMSLVLGMVLFGVRGMSAEMFTRCIVSSLAQIPMSLGCICFGHCLLACFRKSGSTIAAYLLTMLLFSTIIQLFMMFLPAMSGYLSMLDWQTAGKAVSEYWTMPAGQFLFAECMGLVTAVVTTVIGINRFRAADLH